MKSSLIALSEQRRAAIDVMLRKEGINRLAEQLIPRHSNTGVIPLSFAQQRLWFIEQLVPESPVYIIPVALRLSGQLSIEALRNSLINIMERHEVLRTTFTVIEGNPFQVIAPLATVPLTVIDLSRLLPEDQVDAVEQYAKAEATCSFDLTRDFPLRIQLLRLAAEEHVLLLTIHHIAADGPSLGILFKELSLLYTGYLQGRSLPLPELPIQYADFAVWQREWLQTQAIEEQLAYWREQLANSVTLNLPTSRPRPAVQTFCGAHHSFSLPIALREGLKRLSRQEDVTLFMTLLAVFQVLLFRYTNQSDITIGTPIANRIHHELERLIGFFTNTLVLRSQVRGTLTFREFLKHVREVCLGAYTHQEVPFEYLVKDLHPDRDLSRQVLFQVVFQVQTIAWEALQLPGIIARAIKIESGVSKFDLTMMVWDNEQDFRGTVEYNTELFDTTTISRMVGHFQTLLEGAISNPDVRLVNMPFLTDTEQRLLEEWSNA